VRRRVEGLLENLRQTGDPGLRQALRLVEVLEQIRSAEAQEALRELASGAVSSRVRQEAQESLGRLTKRSEQGRWVMPWWAWVLLAGLCCLPGVYAAYWPVPLLALRVLCRPWALWSGIRHR
jgi:hypothetical protein